MDDIIKKLEETDIDIDTPKYIKLPLDFFSIPEINALDNYPEKDRLISSWIKLVLSAAKLDNDGKLQVKSNSAMHKKYNPMDPGSHLFPVSVAFFIKIDETKDVEEERKFALRAVDIYFKEGLLGRNDNPKESYLFVKNWDIYKTTKPGPKTEWTRERVEELLKENGYNMSKAARTLGNTKQFISLLAKKFGIKKPEAQKD
ncbi:MAG: phage replisome organizer N-terminal domain-containing protein [bacterium]